VGLVPFLIAVETSGFAAPGPASGMELA
jgi:hypothetical protein